VSRCWLSALACLTKDRRKGIASMVLLTSWMFTAAPLKAHRLQCHFAWTNQG
jgi:hypothetical protein